jgi:NAD(P)-dependent dehydrogenase (short-subunit alcohol dehydrogenase family)
MPSVVVTGAGRGIGLAITRHLSSGGWDVYATARSAADLEDLGRMPQVHPIRVDVTDRSAVARLPEHLPPALDGVVNNAGIIVQGPVEGLSLDDLARQLQVNVTAQIGVVQAVLPHLRVARGRVVFMSSVSGLVTLPGTGAYSASKYALESLADALRVELRPWRIPVSLIEPGPTRTDVWANALDDYDRMTGKLSPALRDLYRSHLVGNRKLLVRVQRLAGDPEKVVAAVDRALTSKRPKRRYRCDNLSRAQVAFASVLPTAATDAVLAAVTTAR